MLCPYCGERMQQGVIQSNQEIAWLPKRHFFSRAMFHTDSVVLSELSLLRGSAVIAWRCAACSKIIIDCGTPCDLNHIKYQE